MARYLDLPSVGREEKVGGRVAVELPEERGEFVLIRLLLRQQLLADDLLQKPFAIAGHPYTLVLVTTQEAAAGIGIVAEANIVQNFLLRLVSGEIRAENIMF